MRGVEVPFLGEERWYTWHRRVGVRIGQAKTYLHLLLGVEVLLEDVNVGDKVEGEGVCEDLVLSNGSRRTGGHLQDSKSESCTHPVMWMYRYPCVQQKLYKHNHGMHKLITHSLHKHKIH